MPAEALDELVPLHCPHLDRLVVRGRQQVLAAWRKVDGAHGGRVTTKLTRLAAGRGLGHAVNPDAHRFVPAGSGQESARGREADVVDSLGVATQPEGPGGLQLGVERPEEYTFVLGGRR